MSARIFFFLITLSPGLARAAEAPPDLAGSAWQMLFGLAVVLALLFGILWLLKRLGMNRGGAGGELKVLGAASVGARERVVMVEVAGRVLVLGVAPGRVNALSEFDAAELPPREPLGEGANAIAGGDFAARLRQMLERRQ